MSSIRRDSRVRDFITPTRVLWHNCGSTGSSIENIDALLHPSNGQVSLWESRFCMITHAGIAPSILRSCWILVWRFTVTFGLKSLRRRRITSASVSASASAAEAMSEIGEKGSTSDHGIRDQTCYLPWCGSHEIGESGFRFIRIDVLDEGAVLKLKSVQGVLIFRDLEYRGSFKCNDDRLNRIWQTGAYTVQLNMQDYLWDGIKRDRLIWIGDMHPETMTIARVFGDIDIVPRSLDLVRDETPLPRWMNTISSYSMWWVLIHEACYMHHGDLNYLKQQEAYLVSLLEQLSGFMAKDGSETLTGMRFLDWPSSDNKEAVHAGLHALMVMTFDAGSKILHALGNAVASDQAAVIGGNSAIISRTQVKVSRRPRCVRWRVWRIIKR